MLSGYTIVFSVCNDGIPKDPLNVMRVFGAIFVGNHSWKVRDTRQATDMLPKFHIIIAYFKKHLIDLLVPMD